MITLLYLLQATSVIILQYNRVIIINNKMAEEQEPQLFAVQPKTNCPHVAAGLVTGPLNIDSMLLLLLILLITFIIHSFIHH